MVCRSTHRLTDSLSLYTGSFLYVTLSLFLLGEAATSIALLIGALVSTAKQAMEMAPLVRRGSVGWGREIERKLTPLSFCRRSLFLKFSSLDSF